MIGWLIWRVFAFAAGKKKGKKESEEKGEGDGDEEEEEEEDDDVVPTAGAGAAGDDDEIREVANDEDEEVPVAEEMEEGPTSDLRLFSFLILHVFLDLFCCTFLIYSLSFCVTFLPIYFSLRCSFRVLFPLFFFHSLLRFAFVFRSVPCCRKSWNFNNIHSLVLFFFF